MLLTILLRALFMLIMFASASIVDGQILKIGHQPFSMLAGFPWTPFPSVIVLNETDIITNYVGLVTQEEINIANDWIWSRRSLNPDGLNVTVNVRDHGYIGPNFMPPGSTNKSVTAVSAAKKSNVATVIFVFDRIAGTIIDIDIPPDTTEDWNGDPFDITNALLQDYDSSLTALPIPPEELDQFEAIYGARNGTHICVYSVIYGQRNVVLPSQLLFCPGAVEEVNNTFSRAWLDPKDNHVFYVTSAYPSNEFHSYKCINDQSNNAICASITQATLPRAITQSHGKIMKGSNIFWYVGTSDGNPIEVIAIDYVANSSNTMTVPTSITGAKAIGLIDAPAIWLNSITMLVYDRSTRVFQVIDLMWNSATGNLTYEKTVPDFGPVEDMYPILGTEIAAANQGNSSFAIATGEALNDTAVYITQFFRRLYCGDGFVLFDEDCDSEEYCNNTTCQCLAGLTNGSCNPYIPPFDVPEALVTPQQNNETDLVGRSPQGVRIEVVVPSVIIPVVVTAVGVILLVVLLRRRNRQKKKSNDELKMNLRGSDGQAPHYLGVPSQSNSALGNTSNTSTNTTNTTSDDNRLDIPYSELKFIREIGSGSFGKVFIGEWQKTSVALKISVVTSAKEFIREAELLINLRPHPNVVQVLGLSTDGVHIVMIMEFCDGGSLDSLVFKKNPPMKEKIHLLSGIAKGIYHLHKNKIVHRDLAARNVLLLRGEPKISDFGMSRKLREPTEHGQTNNSVGPLRWMAPESLRAMVYSTKTDVWSFGILCWEVLSGEEPHLNTDALTIGAAIRDHGATPLIDDQWGTELQSLLKDCWALDPDQRPEFDEICERLQKLDQD